MAVGDFWGTTACLCLLAFVVGCSEPASTATVSGVVMLFPFSFADIGGMQWAQYVHAVVGVVLIAIIIAHIYIGTIGMEGAWDAMGTGEVDLDWARHHHPVWVEEGAERVGRRRAGSVAPAE